MTFFFSIHPIKSAGVAFVIPHAAITVAYSYVEPFYFM